MNQNLKSCVITSFSLAAVLFTFGCSSSSNTGTSSNYHVVVERFGYFGYYQDNQFCYSFNNYCQSGNPYGITDGGCTYLGATACYWNSANTGGSNYNPGYPNSINVPGDISTPIYQASPELSSSKSNSTKDVDLQRAQVEQQDLHARAQFVADQFKMSFDGALQLTQLADTMQKLQTQNKFTGEDQLAISQTALSVAGIKQADFQAAMANYMNNHDNNAFNSLIEQGAKNLGMPSSAALRDQILPSLGLNIHAI